MGLLYFEIKETVVYVKFTFIRGKDIVKITQPQEIQYKSLWCIFTEKRKQKLK